MKRPPILALALLALFSGLCAWTQYSAGAWNCELSFEPDEPAHFVTGLMINSYIREGFPGNPMRYAERYYVRYPKVAIGHWPPLFYSLEALWFLPFGGTIGAALGLQTLITGTLALLIFLFLRPHLNLWALAPATYFLLLRSTRLLSSAVMLELLAVALEILAVFAWKRYMESGAARYAFAFSLWAASALLTRGDALFLAIFPLGAIALSGRWTLLRRTATWASALVVCLLCGPWYFLTYRMMKDGTSTEHAWDYFLTALPQYLQGLPAATGWGVVVLSIAGIAFGAKVAGRDNWASWTALAASLMVFQCIIASSVEERRLAPVVPALLILAAFGALWLTQRFRLPLSAGSLTVISLILSWTAVYTPAKRHFGYREIVSDLLTRPELKGMNLLISSAIDGEGMTISEVAARENIPGRYTIRASKLLASSNWSGATYHSLHDSPQKMIEALAKSPAQIIVTDTFPDHTPELTFEVHNAMLQRTIAEYPGRFRLLARKPGPEGEILAYLLDEGRKSDAVKMEIDLGFTLGRKVGN